MIDKKLLQQESDDLTAYKNNNLTDIEKLQQVLSVLRHFKNNIESKASKALAEVSIYYIRDVLENDKSYPVAWFEQHASGNYFLSYTYNSEVNTKPLYFKPQKKEWKGLSEDEISEEARQQVFNNTFVFGCAWAQKKLKEKNHE